MADDRYPEYEALPLKDSSLWFVSVSFKHGPAHEVHGFASEAEAREWIRKDVNAGYERALASPAPV
jgi:hypothetical protein